MKRSIYTDEFKAEAIKQITERWHRVLDVAKRLGVSDKSLYVWLKRSQQRLAVMTSPAGAGTTGSSPV